MTDTIASLKAELAAAREERDEARQLHLDYTKDIAPDEKDWAIGFFDAAGWWVLQAFGRTRQPDGSPPTYQSLNEIQTKALDRLHEILEKHDFASAGAAALAAERVANAG